MCCRFCYRRPTNLRLLNNMTKRIVLTMIVELETARTTNTRPNSSNSCTQNACTRARVSHTQHTDMRSAACEEIVMSSCMHVFGRLCVAMRCGPKQSAGARARARWSERDKERFSSSKQHQTNTFLISALDLSFVCCRRRVRIAFAHIFACKQSDVKRAHGKSIARNGERERRQSSIAE